MKDLAFKGGGAGPGIVPGKPQESYVFTSTVLPPDHDDLMPPKSKGGPLSSEKTKALANWIEQGAYWPDDLLLTAKKAEEAPGANEMQVVADIRARIMTNSAPTSESAMTAYTNKIPSTLVTYRMTPIRGGEYAMGSPANEPGRQPDEGPVHKVKISPFWMGVHEVTWNEFELFMYADEEKKVRELNSPDVLADKVTDAVTRPTRPYVEMSFGMGKDGFPAISMTQHSANKFCQWLSARAGHFYRLPTEAEWEYACRAGTTTAYSFGNDPALLKEYAWFANNSDFKYQKVGTKKPNTWGLYDMHGNVAEWTLDQYVPGYDEFADGTAIDPWIKASKPYPHSARGGSWDDDPAKLRSASRRGSDKTWKIQDPQLPKSIWYHTDAQFLGFRVVRPLKVPTAEEMYRYWNNGVERD